MSSSNPIIVITLGNTNTTVCTQNHILTRPSALSFSSKKVSLIQNHKQKYQKRIVYNFVMLLGVGYDEYVGGGGRGRGSGCGLERSKNGKIQIKIQKQKEKQRKMPCEALLSLYLKLMLQLFLQLYPEISPSLSELITSHKFYFTLSGSHPYLYSISQSLSMLSINSYIFLNPSHCAIINNFFNHSQNKDINIKTMKNKNKSEKVCVLNFGDRACLVSIYKIHKGEQKVVQVIDEKRLQIGGWTITEKLVEYAIRQIKKDKKMDVSSYQGFVNVLTLECEGVKIGINQNQNRQMYVRVSGLPDSSVFQMSVTQELIQKLIGDKIQSIVLMVKETMAMHNGDKKIKDIFVLGGSSKMSLFAKKINQNFIKEYEIKNIDKQNIWKGIFTLQNQDVVIFDISASDYHVTGQEKFNRNLLNKGDSIPERKCGNTKFPAGQLEFNLRVFENGKKIGTFLLESRPLQSQFGLNFQIDRNKLLNLYVTTNKGKIELHRIFQALNSEDIKKYKIQLENNEY